MTLRRSGAAGALAFAATMALGSTACIIDEVREDEVGAAPGCEAARRWPIVYAEREDELAELINDARQVGGQCGETLMNPVPDLEISPELRCAARVHAVDIADSGELSHTGSNGDMQLWRIDRAQYPNVPKSELIAADFRDPAQLLDTWLSDTTACTALYDSRIIEMGIGHAENEDGDATGWVLWTGQARD